MTLNRRVLRRVHSPLRSPCRTNSSLRKKALIRQLNGEVQFGADSKANLKVVVRVRPFNTREQENNAKCVVDVVDEHMLVFDPQREEDDFFYKGARQRNRDLNKRKNREQKFAFEKVFTTDSTNHQVYETTTHNLLDTLLSGYNCSVFAYGATGAGKTFTMLGTEDCPGITFLTLMELYKRIDEAKEEKTCEVAVSYLEVYNETVRDLLQPGKLLNLQEVGQQVVVPGLSLHKPADAEELMVMLSKGNHNRTQHPTDSNAESSRSHAVFQVFVKQQDRVVSDLKSNVSISKLSMIDLAGSERGAATGFKGVRFREGASINKSLLALGNCINALADGQRHIPYRDSKLTRLLKDSLGGNCRSIMIAAISPASTTFEDTFNTLRYANRAKTIKMTIKKNLLNVDQHVSNYVKIVEDLKEEVCSLKAKIKKYEDKEAEWEKERATLTRPATSPLTTTPGITDQEKLNFEARIAELEAKNADLEEQLMSKNMVASDTSPSPETSETQRALEETSREYRAICCTALRLENAQREIHLKIHFAKARLLRMQVISFASQKLDKSIARCHRTLGNLARQLEQVTRQKGEVEGSMAPILARLDSLQSSQLLPQHLAEKLQANASISEHQENCQYLGRLVGEGFSEQRASEKLISHLLHTAKQYYVQLRAQNLCTPQFSQIFQNVVDSLDESKIAWADQQSEGEGDGGNNGNGSSSSNEAYTNTTLPSLDVAYFTNFQVNSTVRISPAIVTQERPSHRKSSLKSSSSMVNLPELPSECLAHSGDPRPSPVFPSPVPEEEEVFSPATPVTPHSRTAPIMPLLSTFSAVVKSPLPVITTHSLLPSTSPHSYLSHSPGISLSSELRTSQTTPQTHILRKSEEVSKVREPLSIGFVSITQGCGITTLKTGSNTTELQDDIQPVDCSINGTFSVTPGKSLNTIDLPSNSSEKTKNSDPVCPNIISVTSTVSTLSIPNFRSGIASKPSSSANMTFTDIEAGSQLAAISTIPKNSEVTNEKSQLFGSVCHGVGDAECVSSLNQTITVTEDPEHTNKTASRKLFLNARPQALSTMVLDSTFNVGDDSALLEIPDTPLPPVRSSADITERDSVSPDLANDSHQPGKLKNEPPQHSPLQSLTNTTLHTPAIAISVPGEPPKPPPSKGKLSKQRSGITPHKSGMQGGVSTTTTTGKTSLLRTGSMRRSVSTPSLAAAASASSSSRATKPSPVLKRKFTGGALHRSSSILHPRTPHMSNQENVPPGSTRKPGIHSSIHRETLSSAAKHTFTYAKP